jgi:hypothetical protein
MPSQVPLHVGSVPTQAVRDPTATPVTGEHVPLDAGRLHASHWPPQALLQQTPSVQNEEAHWPPDVHAAPS